MSACKIPKHSTLNTQHSMARDDVFQPELRLAVTPAPRRRPLLNQRFPRVEVIYDFPRGWKWRYFRDGRPVEGNAASPEEAQAIGDYHMVKAFSTADGHRLLA